MGQVYQTVPATATSVDRQALRDAWIALLGRWEWEWFCTFTTRENQIVLDPFMGSGTTAVAAMNLNRHFIGFEIVPKYHEDSLERLMKKTHRSSQVHNITETKELPILELV
jgi:DNA methylase